MASSIRKQARALGAAVALALASPLASAVCVPGSAPAVGQEPSLQYLFDTWLGACAVGAADDRLPDGGDASWRATGTAAVTILIEVAGFASQNIFGLYDATDPNVFLPVFLGSSGPGSSASVTFTASASGYTVSLNGGAGGSVSFASRDFGYYINTPQGDRTPSGTPSQWQPTFYSDSALNGDGQDHLWAYRGDGETFATTGGSYAVPASLRGTTFASNAFLLAWEDLQGGGDRDYQDMVLMVREVTPVPLPAAAGLLALGVFGLAGFARRRESHSID